MTAPRTPEVIPKPATRRIYGEFAVKPPTESETTRCKDIAWCNVQTQRTFGSINQRSDRARSAWLAMHPARIGIISKCRQLSYQID